MKNAPFSLPAYILMPGKPLLEVFYICCIAFVVIFCWIKNIRFQLLYNSLKARSKDTAHFQKSKIVLINRYALKSQNGWYIKPLCSPVLASHTIPILQRIVPRPIKIKKEFILDLSIFPRTNFGLRSIPLQRSFPLRMLSKYCRKLQHHDIFIEFPHLSSSLSFL